jgi:CBS domain-containing protein
MRAHDLMTTPVHSVRPSTTVGEAAAILTRFAITALPVLDADDHLIGMVSEADLLWHRVPASSDAHLWRRPDDRVEDPPGTVGDVMSSPALALTPGTEAADVAELLVSADLSSVPIVEGSTVVGIVSRRDLLRSLVRRSEALAAEARGRLDEYGGGVRHWDVTVEDGVATVSGEIAAAEERVIRILVGTVPGIRTVHVSAVGATHGPA